MKTFTRMLGLGVYALGFMILWEINPLIPLGVTIMIISAVLIFN
jgi:hypothetical protein